MMSKHTNKAIASYLVTLRNEHCYTQNFVATQIDLSRSGYAHYESGKNKPTTNALFRLAEFYNISTDAFLACLVTDLPIVTALPSPDLLIDPMNKTDYDLYIHDEKNLKRIKNLSPTERHLLFYYSKLSSQDQLDLMALLKLRTSHNNEI